MSLPIIIAAGAAVYLFTSSSKGSSKVSGKGSGSNGSSSKDPCPTSLTFTETDVPFHSTMFQTGTYEQTAYLTPEAAIKANDSGEKNPVVLAKLTLAPFIPQQCMEDFGVKITVKNGGQSRDADAPSVVFTWAEDIYKDLVNIGRYSEQDKITQTNNLANWWQKIAPGKPVPNWR